MPEQDRFVGSSIEELLVAIATGAREAQAALDDGPLVDASGRPLSTYRLPYLEFSVQVDMETRREAGGRPIAFLLKTPTKGSSVQSVRSNISGRFVATPPGEGLPIPIIRMASGMNRGGEAPITLRVANSAGEVLADQLVELNIDDASSRALSAARGQPSFERSPGTRLRDALVVTDAEGVARTALLIDTAQPAGGIVVVVSSIGPHATRAAISVEQLA